MDNKTKMLLLVGIGVGGYLLYQKQASDNPFTWLPIVHPTTNAPLSQGTAPLYATGIAAGASLLPSLSSAIGTTIGNISSWFGGSTQSVPTVADYTSWGLTAPGSGVYADPSMAGGYTTVPLNFDYMQPSAGYGVLLPEFSLDPVADPYSGSILTEGFV